MAFLDSGTNLTRREMNHRSLRPSSMRCLVGRHVLHRRKWQSRSRCLDRTRLLHDSPIEKSMQHLRPASTHRLSKKSGATMEMPGWGVSAEPLTRTKRRKCFGSNAADASLGIVLLKSARDCPERKRPMQTNGYAGHVDPLSILPRTSPRVVRSKMAACRLRVSPRKESQPRQNSRRTTL